MIPGFYFKRFCNLVLYLRQKKIHPRLDSIWVDFYHILLRCILIVSPFRLISKIRLWVQRASLQEAYMTVSSQVPPKYTMTISRLTVDKLGVRLYDKVSAVLAELVANSYDADATEVEISSPMGKLLAQKQSDQIIDKGYVIEVRDNGTGMTPDEVNDFYLRVGAERRRDPRRGDISRVFKRKVMGRKGVGKLAPFGICHRIEVISAGGASMENINADGQSTTGYLTAHLILDRTQILSESDDDYAPVVGDLDETLSPASGTMLRLTIFTHRFVPSLDDLNRQLAQRFGVQTGNWRIVLTDTATSTDSLHESRVVGSFGVATMDGTKISFDKERNTDGNEKLPLSYRAFNPNGDIRSDLEGGFVYEERFYGVIGWIAYAKQNYKDDLMAGVRIYCRGKIAAQTSIFNLKSGFTGEHDVRSYLVGELHADWLDEDEDLIQTDRRDILWSHELGQAFEEWGQSVVKKVGVAARNPLKKKTWDVFKETSRIDQRINQAFPVPNQKPLREQAMLFAKMIGQTMREDEVRDPSRVESVVQLSLSFAPHVTLDEKLREAASAEASPLAVMTEILKTAHMAELSSYGRIADERIKVIGRVESLKDDPKTLEAVFQNLIQEAPWLIDPQWSPISANQSFATLRTEFEKYYQAKTGQSIQLNQFSDVTKRADFVLSTQSNMIQIIEIKRPHHRFENEEMVRLQNYIDQMENFLNEPNHQAFTTVFGRFHVTLVCDGEQLTGVYKQAFTLLREKGLLTYISWTAFLANTRQMHQAFLNEAERQKRDAAQV